MKIGIYGGSFNPPHKMHKYIACELIKKGYLDKVIVVPTADSYDKPNLLPGKLRYRMLKGIFKNNKNVEVSSYEIEGRLYTINTLNYYKKIYPNDEIYFVLGADLFSNFYKWKDYEKILTKYKLLVVPRSNNDYEKDAKKYAKYKKNIIFAPIKLNLISSTKIREEIAKNGITKGLNEYLYADTIKLLQSKNGYNCTFFTKK